MPVLPAVATTIVAPGASFPSCSALRMMPIAARSFTLPPGLRYSSLANTSADPRGTRRLSWSMGVSPTSWVMSSATRRPEASEAFERTLQGKGRGENRQSGRGSIVSSLRSAGGGLRSGVVAALGANREFVVAFGFGIDANLAETAIGAGVRGLVADQILVADVMGDGLADLIHLVQSLGEKCHPAGTLGNDFQGALGALRMLLVSQNSNRINRRAILVLQLLYCLLQRFTAGVVFTIGHDEEDLLIEPRVFFQMVRRGHNCFVEGGASASIDFLQSFF